MFLPSLSRKKNLPRTHYRRYLSILFRSVKIAHAKRIKASGFLPLTGRIFKFLKIKNPCISTPLLTQIQEKGWNFLIRVRECVKGIVQGLDAPETEEIDADFHIMQTRCGDKFPKKIESVITNLDRENFSHKA